MKHIYAVTTLTLVAFQALAADWPQFRGPNSSGRVDKDHPLPAEIGPNANVLWKTPLPPGHSSPVVVGDRVYLTGVRDKKLVTIALDRSTGKILWETQVLTSKLEKIHKIGSHAQSTPVADSERVISFFGSAGLFCHDRDGKLVWQKPMGPFINDFGQASSPIIVGEWVILSQDHDQNSFLTAIDKRTGKTIWTTDRSEFLRGFCTPVIWEVNGKKQVVIAGTLRVAGYDLDTGKEIWTVHGLARTICATPVIGDDNRLYLSGWAKGGDPGDAIPVEPFEDAIQELDKNKNGTLQRDELKTHPFGERFSQVNTSGSGSISRQEYERFRDLFKKGRNSVIAINPGGKGDVTKSHVAWENVKQVPFCSSPLFYRGVIYTVKDGGLLSSMDAATGKVQKFERLPDSSAYYSSPVAGDGKVYTASSRGTVAVLQAGPMWDVLSSSDFGEDVYATPAIVDGRIYLRTLGSLYCFGVMGKR